MGNKFAAGLTAERIRAALDYNPATGALTWRARVVRDGRWARWDRAWNTRFAGKVAGGIRYINVGSVVAYWQLGFDGCVYEAHRLIWFHHYGSPPRDTIDHIDRNGLNNAIANLRDVSQRDNLLNRGMQGNNTSGRTGVSWDADRGLWAAEIHARGRKIYLGRFDAFEAACAAREQAEKAHHVIGE